MNRKGEFQLIRDCSIGDGTTVWNFVNLYGCTIGKNCMIGSFVEIQNDVEIGNNCRIQSHSFVCSLVTIGNNVFVGHGVMFINDVRPPRSREFWKETRIGDSVVIGSNATIMPVAIGDNSIIGAGAVVTKDVPPNTIVAGNPARILQRKQERPV
ncbi:MAG TPA: acyltransferase [Bacteroidota bacterium]|nr:acyltransferase [Bacteroidota bacterium]